MATRADVFELENRTDELKCQIKGLEKMIELKVGRG